MLNLLRTQKKLNKHKFRWTLDKKVGGLAYILLCLLGGVSSFFYFEISKMSRELQKITQNDLPIYEITTALIIGSNQQKLILEEINFIHHNYKFHPEFSTHEIHLSKVSYELGQLEQEINSTLSTGIKLAQLAIERAENQHQLSQDREDYHQLKSLLFKLQLSNQEFNSIIKQFLHQNFEEQATHSVNSIQKARIELQDFERLIEETKLILKEHIDIVVNHSPQERTLEIKNIIIISFGAFLLGLFVTHLLIKQIKLSIKTIIKKAKFIAENIDQAPLNHQALVIDSNDEIGDLSVAFNQMIEKFFISQTERKRIANQLLLEKKIAQWDASHDSLTDLVNRREFESQLSQIFNRQESTRHSLLYFDLDRFKIINDTCGHNAGDKLLRQVSKILQTQIRSSDTLARLGGDEFAVILFQCPKQKAVEVAQKILTSIQQLHFIWEKRSFTIGVSIGVIYFNSQEDTLTSVLKAADAACYSAKNLGRNQIYVMENKEQELAQKSQEMNWLSTLHQALELDRFVLFYQKIQPLQTEYSGSEHYEILLRIKGQNGQIIPPMAFLPIAERYKLMNQIDRWVIRTLFATQGPHYRKRGRIAQQNDYACLYAINLSGETLNDADFVQFIKKQVEHHQIPPQFICFEITETVAIANLSQTKLMITQLQELGCRFALDDFGSGMSSFAYLKNLPVDFLKIDGIFTRELLQDPVNSFILQSFHQVAQRMGIATIAEYVDSEEKLVQLKSLGIDYAQGYWIGKPQALPKLQLLTSNQDVA